MSSFISSYYLNTSFTESNLSGLIYKSFFKALEIKTTFVPPAELITPTRIPIKQSKTEIEKQPLMTEAKVSTCYI